MLLQSRAPSARDVQLFAARQWVNFVYSGIHSGARLGEAVEQLGRLLGGVIQFIRIGGQVTGAVHRTRHHSSQSVIEWRRHPAADPAAEPMLAASGAQAPWHSVRGEHCLSLCQLTEPSGTTTGLLLSHSHQQCETLLSLAFPQALTPCPLTFGEAQADLLFYVIPQLAQIGQLLHRLGQPLHSLAVTHSLLQLVPMPLVAVNNSLDVMACNPAARHMLQRLGGDRHTQLPARMLQRQQCVDLRYDGARRQLRWRGAQVDAHLLFQETWLREEVSIFGLQDCRGRPSLNHAVMQALYDLSGAEISVCEWVLAGQEPAQIVVLQSRSINTIKSQLRAVYAKLGVSNTAQLASRLFVNPAYWIGRRYGL